MFKTRAPGFVLIRRPTATRKRRKGFRRNLAPHLGIDSIVDAIDVPLSHEQGVPHIAGHVHAVNRLTIEMDGSSGKHQQASHGRDMFADAHGLEGWYQDWWSNGPASPGKLAERVGFEPGLSNKINKLGGAKGTLMGSILKKCEGRCTVSALALRLSESKHNSRGWLDCMGSCVGVQVSEAEIGRAVHQAAILRSQRDVIKDRIVSPPSLRKLPPRLPLAAWHCSHY